MKEESYFASIRLPRTENLRLSSFGRRILRSTAPSLKHDATRQDRESGNSLSRSRHWPSIRQRDLESPKNMLPGALGQARRWITPEARSAALAKTSHHIEASGDKRGFCCPNGEGKHTRTAEFPLQRPQARDFHASPTSHVRHCHLFAVARNADRLWPTTTLQPLLRSRKDWLS